MPLLPTVLLLIAGLALTGACAWFERRPLDLGGGSPVPLPVLMGLGLLVAIAAAAHLLSLTTGIDLPGRRM